MHTMHVSLYIQKLNPESEPKSGSKSGPDPELQFEFGPIRIIFQKSGPISGPDRSFLSEIGPVRIFLIFFAVRATMLHGSYKKMDIPY